MKRGTELPLAVLRTDDRQIRLLFEDKGNIGMRIVSHFLEGAIPVPGLDIELLALLKIQMRALGEIVDIEARGRHFPIGLPGKRGNRAHIFRDLAPHPRGIAQQPDNLHLWIAPVQLFGNIARIVAIAAPVKRAENRLVRVNAAEQARRAHQGMPVQGDKRHNPFPKPYIAAKLSNQLGGHFALPPPL